MDLWDWVHDVQEMLEEQGEDELIAIMDNVSSDTVDGKHERLDQYIETGVQRARELGLGWVEVFLRHWRLQSEVLVRNNAKNTIKEAISLLEFAHHPENKDCPQSICAVQDLANCYAIFDGPGFFEERLQVAKENLEKIDAHWPCYVCISTEYATALIDAKRYQQCIVFLEDCDQEMVKCGEGKDTSDILLAKSLAFMRMGDYKKARQGAKKVRSQGGGSNLIVRKKILQALIEALDGCYDQTIKYLPALQKVNVVRSEMARWAEVKYLLAVNSESSITKLVFTQLEEIIRDMEARGVYRDAFNTLGLLAELYNRSGKTIESNQAIGTMERLKSCLNKDAGAAARIRELTQAVS